MSEEKKVKEHSWDTSKTPTKTADVADTRVFADPMASSTQGPSGAVFKGTIQHSTGAEVAVGVDPCKAKPQQVWQSGESQTAPLHRPGAGIASGSGDPTILQKPLPPGNPDQPMSTARVYSKKEKSE